MTKSEKIAFVNQLVDTIRGRIIHAIEDGRIPDDWDGFELRQLLADRFTAEAFKMAKERQNAYLKTIRFNT